MPSRSLRRVSRQDIQLVQNLIERCLQLYMNREEVVQTLFDEAKIEPGFTKLVWQKLEEENQEFFKAYYLRLGVKRQIMEFNRLLEQHMELMIQLHPTEVVSLPNPDGSHNPALHQNPACYAVEQMEAALKPENTQHTVGSSLPNLFNNGGSSLHTNMHSNASSLHVSVHANGSSLHTNMHAAVDMSAHANRIDAPPTMLSAQCSNLGLMQVINGSIIKPERGYSGSSPFMFCADGNVLETCPTIGDASVNSLPSVETNLHPRNEFLLNSDIFPFGNLGQIPRNSSLSDLTADFSQSSDIPDTYAGSPFLATDDENLQDNRRLDSMSEGLSYDYFVVNS